MHQFLSWIVSEQDVPHIELDGPATSAELDAFERELGEPLPTDHRLVLARFNGARLPGGRLLSVGQGESSIGAALREVVAAFGSTIDDQELLLPFYANADGSLLAFDRSAGPVADTWPVVDWFPDSGEARLVFRTFDGWCRSCLDEWTSEDFSAEFSLDKYLRQGQRHVRVEPDVASAHATVAHALKRSGRPEDALQAYLRAARCVPPLSWCDWEALKLAVLLRLDEPALEAAGRLCTPAPAPRWRERATQPALLADVVGIGAARTGQRAAWLRLLDQLVPQAGADRAHVVDVRRAVVGGGELPPPRVRPPVLPPLDDLAAWWSAAREAYGQGTLRDEDLLLDPALRPLAARYELAELLRIRREF